MQSVHVKYALLILVTGFVGYLCYLMAAPFLMAIAWAVVLAILINPLYLWLLRYLRSTSAAAALACTAAILVVVLPLAAIGVMVTQSILHFISAQASEGAATTTVISNWFSTEVDKVTDWLGRTLGLTAIRNLDLSDIIKSRTTYLADQTRILIGGVAGFLFNLVVVVFTLFFFLRDQDKVLRGVREFMPLSDENATAVFDRVYEVIRASVIGGGAVAVVQGVLAGVGYWFVGLPTPAIWGVVTAIISFVPVIGAAGVWVPAALYLLAIGETREGIILACYGAFVVSLVDNFLRPALIGDATRLHTLLIFFSILGGLQVFGFLGLIMGPVVLAVGLALVEIFRREILESEERERATGRLPAHAVNEGND